ncbi:MAG: acetyl-CoA C-acyltransferase [Saprospiraceae bacterium]|nr:acetyl-CoA C-acyltransferase [Saprospiraceae bacterium]
MMHTYIIDAVRTPIGNLAGNLSAIRPDDLAAHVLRELLKKQPNVPADAIADVILGCANQAGEDNRNVARMATILAGLPVSIPAETVNRLCASGMSAIIQAHRTIQCGDGDIVIAGGVESMTRASFVLGKTSTPFSGDTQLFDSTFGWRFINPIMQQLCGTDSMGTTAENLADIYHIHRSDQDKFAHTSQQKATTARKRGRFAEEIIGITIPIGKKDTMFFDTDEFIKPFTTLDGLAKLRPAFRKETGTVTAGNSSGLNDGAAAMLLASEHAMSEHQLQPMARIVASAVVGVEPRIMGIGPVEASQRALRKARLSLSDISVIEINEAFAAQVLACTRQLGIADDDPRLNRNGGAIALGHPLGMSGTRIVQTAAIELQKTGGQYALCTMCVGVGQGYAVIIERC